MSQQYSIVANIVAKTEQFTKSMNDATKKADGFASNFAAKTKAIGTGMTNVGKELTTKVSLPLAAIGTASLKLASDFEAQMSRVGAIAQASGSEMDALKKSAMELGAETSKSAGEVARGMEDLAALGFSTTQILEAMPGVISASEAAGSDLATTAGIVASALNAFQMEASEASKVADILAMTANVSAASVEDMGYAFKYSAPVANSLGVSIEELSASIGIMTNAGLEGSQAGTSLRGGLISLLKPAEKTSKLMDAMGITVEDASGNFVGMSGLIENLSEAMENQTDVQKLATLASIVGTEAATGFLTLMEAGPEKIDEFTHSLENSSGASKEAADVMKDNLKGTLEELGGSLETAAISIGNVLIPIVRDLALFIQKLVEKFNSLSPTAQKTIVFIGGIVTAIGPLLLVVGSMLTGLSSAVTLFGAAGGAAGIFSGALAVLTGPIGLIVAGLTAVTVAGVALYKHLSQDAIPEVDRFGDSVSDATKQALEGFFELSDGVGAAVADMKIRGIRVTEEMASEMIGKFDNMNQQILTGLETKHAERIASMESFFLNSSVLTDAEEAKILQQQENSHSLQILSLESKNERVKEILQTAAEENRVITQAEADEINNIKNAMNENAVEALSASEIEQQIIMERMKQTAGDLSALQAAEVVKNSAEARDGAIQAAEEQYDRVIAEIIRMRDETGVISEEQATKLIAEATRSKDEAIKHAEIMHSDVVEEAKGMATGVDNEIDWMTGEVRSKFETMQYDAADTMLNLATSIIKSWNSLGRTTRSYLSNMLTDTTKYFSNIRTAVETSIETAKNQAIEKVSSMATSLRLTFSNIVTSAREKFDEVKSKIVEPVEKARDTVKKVVDTIKGFFDNMSLSIPEIKLPSLPKPKISGGFSLDPPSVPKISWNKFGGVFSNPTIFPTNGTWQGVGEGGSREAILPLNSKTYAGIGAGIAKNLNLQNLQPQEINYHFDFHVDKMIANEHSGKQLAKTVADEFTNKLKRERGVR